MYEQQTQHTDGTRRWGRFFGFLAGGILLGLAVGEPGPLGLIGGIVGVVAALSGRNESPRSHLVEIGAFVCGAYRDGDIDTESYERLADRLRARGFWMAPATQVVPEAEAPAPMAASSTAVATAPARPRPASPAVVPTPPRRPVEPPIASSRPVAPPPVKPPATPTRPPTPSAPIPERHPVPAPTPRQVPTFLSSIFAPIQRFWQALAGDFAVQGLGSLGVLLVFTATLGFVFFAFTSVGVAYRPIAEVLVPVVLFGMAAFLRRRNASFMAAAVEFLGGAVTPVMVFAAIVDGSAFLPDLERGALVTALASAALVMAAAYGWMVHRRPTSPLRFLVAPLVWSAVGVVGLVFHEGASAAQMALVVGAVAATAWVVKLRPGGALAVATRLMAPFGLVVAYALVLVFALAEDWPLGPMVAAGIAAIAAAEAMRSVVSRTWLVEAAVVVATAAAATVTVEPAWVGVAAAATFLALAERWAIAGEDDADLTVRVLGGAALAGAFVAIWEPEPLIAVSGLITVWANLRRFRPLPGLELATAGAAAIAPVGIVVGLALLVDVPTAVLVGAVAVLAVSLGVRLTAPDDVFYQMWVVGAALLVAAGAAAGWPFPTDDYRLGAAVVMAAIAVVLPRIRVDVRVWTAAALAYWGWILLAEAAQLSGDVRAVVVAAAGLGLVLAGMFVPGRNGGSVAAVGHVVALSAFAFVPQSWWLVGALAGWVTGWVAEVVTEDRSPLQRLGGAEVSATDVSWVQAIVLALSVPVLAAFTALEIWPDAEFVALTWTAALLGVGYAGLAGFVTIRPRLGEAAAVGSIILTTAAVGLASAEFDVAVASDRVIQMGALASGIVAVGLVGGRRRLWMHWYAWFLSLQLTVVAAMALGVAEADVYWALIAWGGLALIGSLATDEIRSGIRPIRTVVRDARLWPPFVLGAFAAVSGIATGLVVPIEAAWPVAVAGLAISGVVALQLRLGVLSAATWTLATYATVSGLMDAGYDLAADPWLLVAPTLALLAAAVILPGRADWVIRWDLPPLVVGLLLGTATVGLGYEAASTATTWVPIGVGLVLAAVLKRWWALAPFGFVLLLGAAYLAGHGWFSAALAATMLATGIAARMTNGEIAAALQWLSAGFAAAAWVELTLALGLSENETLTAERGGHHCRCRARRRRRLDPAGWRTPDALDGAVGGRRLGWVRLCRIGHLLRGRSVRGGGDGGCGCLGLGGGCGGERGPTRRVRAADPRRGADLRRHRLDRLEPRPRCRRLGDMADERRRREHRIHDGGVAASLIGPLGARIGLGCRGLIGRRRGGRCHPLAGPDLVDHRADRCHRFQSGGRRCFSRSSLVLPCPRVRVCRLGDLRLRGDGQECPVDLNSACTRPIGRRRTCPLRPTPPRSRSLEPGPRPGRIDGDGAVCRTGVGPDSPGFDRLRLARHRPRSPARHLGHGNSGTATGSGWFPGRSGGGPADDRRTAR